MWKTRPQSSSLRNILLFYLMKINGCGCKLLVSLSPGVYISHVEEMLYLYYSGKCDALSDFDERVKKNSVGFSIHCQHT